MIANADEPDLFRSPSHCAHLFRNLDVSRERVEAASLSLENIAAIQHRVRCALDCINRPSIGATVQLTAAVFLLLLLLLSLLPHGWTAFYSLHSRIEADKSSSESRRAEADGNARARTVVRRSRADISAR